MNQFESVLAAARQAILDKAQATARARDERQQAFQHQMEPTLRSEARRRGRNSPKYDRFDDDYDWGTSETA